MQQNETIRTTKRNSEDKKALIHRLNRINGQIRGITKMIEEDRYCEDILIQLSAVEQSVKSLASILLERHLTNCVKNDILEGKDESLNEVVHLFKRF